MKTILRYTGVLLLVGVFSGCIKTYTVPQNNLVGSWILTDAAQGGQHGWSAFYTGLEGGVFDFYNNGAAVYTDQQLRMQGSWRIQTVSGGYYDEYGMYYTDVHDELQLQLSDAFTGSSVNLYFNDVSFSGGRLTGTYYDGNYLVRYRFARY